MLGLGSDSESVDRRQGEQSHPPVRDYELDLWMSFHGHSSVPDPNPNSDPDPPDPRVFGLPDPDPLVRGMDPDPALDPDPYPSIIMQK